MDTTVVDVSSSEALIKLREYKQHVNTPGSVDWEIERVYRLISQGKKIIRAIDSIRKAGVDLSGRPKLALIRADANEAWYRHTWLRNGRKGGLFATNSIMGSGRIAVPDMPEGAERFQSLARAVVPHVPVHVRPKHDLANYHILWEADWHDYPVDPMLLRRVGKGDVWVVLAAWDLTEVERAVLSGRS